MVALWSFSCNHLHTNPAKTRPEIRTNSSLSELEEWEGLVNMQMSQSNVIKAN